MTRNLPALKDRKINKLNLFAGVLVVLVGYIWLLGLVDKIIMPLVVRRGVEIQIPDMHFLTIVQADSICKKCKLEITNIKTRLDDRYMSGIVLDQYPIAGTVVKPGRRVDLVISERSGLVVCPDLTGKSPREAQLIAEAAGLAIRIEHNRFKHSESVPEGVIIEQDPSPSTGLALHSRIVVTISLGPLPAQIVVPNLVGRNLEEVRFLLNKYNLALGEVIRFPDRSHPEGTVFEQDPPAGSPPPESGGVDIRIAIQPLDREPDSLE